jgi:hypothetical protein
MKLIPLVVLTLAVTHFTASATQDAGDNVVLVTLDGVRTEELFGGLDLEVLRSTLPTGRSVEETPAYQRYWAPTPEERRRKLMPFFWQLVTLHGSVAGNARIGSEARLRNTHRFSYPGYAEILTGEARDSEITSNDPIRNPFTTVLEGIRRDLKLRPAQVATFASWEIITHIAEHEPGSTFVNAGLARTGHPDAESRLVDALQLEARTPWGGIRHDAFTYRLAKAYLSRVKPRVLFLSFDETDDHAHDGRYDQVLASLEQTDAYLRDLWTWLQSTSQYQNRTHLIITTDHGRGHTLADWRNHGADVVGADEVWIALVSPRLSKRGEWRNAAPVSTSQIAATLAWWMGINWNASHPNAGRPFEETLRR